MRFSTVLLLAAAIPAAADEIHLRWGTKLEGKIVSRTRKEITIDTGSGVVGIPAHYVVKIVESGSAVQEYQERLKDLDARGASAKEYYELAKWCRKEGLAGPARKVLLQVIAMDPDHEEARRDLGYEKVGDRWLTHDEAMEARGYVKFEGAWILREERDRILREREEERKREREERKREEEARRRAEEERRRAEEEERRRESDRPGVSDARIVIGSWYRWPYGWYGYGWPCGGPGWGWHYGSHWGYGPGVYGYHSGFHWGTTSGAVPCPPSPCPTPCPPAPCASSTNP